MRIALCGIHEEVNMFAVETMRLASVTGDMSTGFQRFEGQALNDVYKGMNTWPGGWVDGFLGQQEVEFVPVAFYNYTAGPTIQGEAYRKMKKDILDSLKVAMPLDAVAIQMHGAGVAEGVDDIEGDLCAAIRALVGPKVKLAYENPNKKSRPVSDRGKWMALQLATSSHSCWIRSTARPFQHT